MAVTARYIEVTGQVQGVGFRPFVYRLARELSLTGHVGNDGAGVRILAQGPSDLVAEFERRLPVDAPKLAKIAHLSSAGVAVDSRHKAFHIHASSATQKPDPQVTVDVRVCDRCIAELRDTSDFRYDYPFINCTDCGPRYSIVRGIPYDRVNTSMSHFEMCDRCASQYNNPSDRRFHAQPVACPDCGPHVWLADSAGAEIDTDDPIGTLADMLLGGKIAAIKGLGGFHLACRADDDAVVGRLRERKNRDAKPFAVMAADIEAIASLCELRAEAAELLESPVSPIVLLPALANAPVCGQVAQGMNTLGVMLPYTPLHVILFDRLASRCVEKNVPPLVMTSGNTSDQPIEKDNESALDQLGAIADILLLHDRPIVRRVEDSVVQSYPDGHFSVVRRGRGYAPQSLAIESLGKNHPTILAVGAELKSAICLLHEGTAVLGEHLGDIKNAESYRNFLTGVESLQELFGARPLALAADMHPQYLSTQYARKRAGCGFDDYLPAELTLVQHHHAHAASCLAEHGRTGPAIALVCDGVGWGDDHCAWGGEILIADLGSYKRVGHIRYLPLLGGDLAARQAWRPALAALVQCYGESCMEHLPDALSEADLHLIKQSLPLALRESGTMTSSLGRWFDAVAWLTGIVGENTYEGQAAMMLESHIDDSVTDSYPFTIDGTSLFQIDQRSVATGLPDDIGVDSRGDNEKTFQIDLRPVVIAISDDLDGGASAGRVAARFHNTVISFLTEAAALAAAKFDISTVVLSGGCFANRRLCSALAARLCEQGLEVLRHEQVPCNDGGIAMGQAAVAAWRAMHSQNQQRYIESE